MCSKVVTFNNGQKCPILGLGTFQTSDGNVNQAVKDAIDIGFRLIDTAFFYNNEKEVGAAIGEKIKEGVITRENVFVTTKLWNTFHRPELVESAIKESLGKLGLDYVDLYLMHFPLAFKEGDALIPVREDNSCDCVDIDYLDTWKAMEQLCKKGLTKSIGVSNFNKAQIERILQNCEIKPVTNQVECHPYLVQTKLSDYLKSKNIVVTAYSPLGAPASSWLKPETPNLGGNPKLAEIAAKHGKSWAQVAIRYQIDRGHIVIPKSVSKNRLAENFDVWDFKLDRNDMDLVGSLNCDGRIIKMLTSTHDKNYPFHDEF